MHAGRLLSGMIRAGPPALADGFSVLVHVLAMIKYLCVPVLGDLVDGMAVIEKYSIERVL